jgi:5-formyltetrahydrofolate cyclo-ligase
MNDTKRRLRADMRAVRAAISDRAGRSLRLAEHVVRSLGLTSTGGLRVLAFVGVGTEPDTTVLIDLLLQENVAVYLPRVIGDDIEAVRYQPGSVLESGAFGIPAPTGPSVRADQIDVVLVPGLAFTSDGRRLGQGGGFYDRYLPRLRPGCITVGLCFAEQIVAQLPTEAHDQRVSRVITDDVRQ